MNPPGQRLRSLVGVYHADGGLRGELSYVLGSLLGTTSCSLCHLTHSRVRRRADWDRMAEGLPVPFALLHRNETDPALAAFIGHATPVVVARTDGGLRTVLDPAALDSLDGSVRAFEQALGAALAAAGLAPATSVEPGRA